MNKREKFFHWFLKKIKYPKGDLLNKPLILLWSFLFPIKCLYYTINKNEGYNIRGYWTIHGQKYSDNIFYYFADNKEFIYKFKRDKNNMIIIEIIGKIVNE